MQSQLDSGNVNTPYYYVIIFNENNLNYALTAEFLKLSMKK